MKEHTIIVSYPESTWEYDVVKFYFADPVSMQGFKEALEEAQSKAEGKDFICREDRAEEIFGSVAEKFGGVWNYETITSEIEIRNE